jgi:hypothetical protein
MKKNNTPKGAVFGGQVSPWQGAHLPPIEIISCL